MILTNDPGNFEQYPIFAHAVVREDNKVENRLITRPSKVQYENHTMYGMMFGGCMWYYTISNDPSEAILTIGLQKNGSLPLIPQHWENMAIIQQIGKVLRGEIS
jgi:hypothetical protein